jgi:protein tyrosine phosphatase
MDNVITRQSEFFTDLISKIKAMETEIEAMKESNLSSTTKWLNGDAVMQKLGVSRRTLQTYRDNRILPYSVVGSKFYYSIKDIEDLMKSNYVPVN